MDNSHIQASSIIISNKYYVVSIVSICNMYLLVTNSNIKDLLVYIVVLLCIIFNNLYVYVIIIK
jgi:hypothetical protein